LIFSTFTVIGTGSCWRRDNIGCHGVFARHDAANADRLLADRAQDRAARNREAVVEPAAVVAVEQHEAALAVVIPDDVAERILDIEIDVVGMAVGPAIVMMNSALVSILPAWPPDSSQERQEEQEGDDLQRLEQHHAERIERPVAR